MLFNVHTSLLATQMFFWLVTQSFLPNIGEERLCDEPKEHLCRGVMYIIIFKF